MLSVGAHRPRPREAVHPVGNKAERDRGEQPLPVRLFAQRLQRAVETAGLLGIVLHGGYHDEHAEQAVRDALGDVARLAETHHGPAGTLALELLKELLLGTLVDEVTAERDNGEADRTDEDLTSGHVEQSGGHAPLRLAARRALPDRESSCRHGERAIRDRLGAGLDALERALVAGAMMTERGLA